MGAAGFGAAAGLSLAGGVWGALAGDAAGAYNESMAKWDAKQLDDMAVDTIARGEDEVSRAGEAARGFIGKQRAALAGQGLDVGTGTAADLQMETMTLNQRDIDTIRANAAREALGLRVQAISTRAGAKGARRASENAAIGTLLTGGAQALSIASQGLENNNNITNRSTNPKTPNATGAPRRY